MHRPIVEWLFEKVRDGVLTDLKLDDKLTHPYQQAKKDTFKSPKVRRWESS